MSLTGLIRHDRCIRILAAPHRLPDIHAVRTSLYHVIRHDVIDPHATPTVVLAPGLDRRHPRGRCCASVLTADCALPASNVSAIPRHPQQDAVPLRGPLQVFDPAVGVWYRSDSPAGAIEQMELK